MQKSKGMKIAALLCGATVAIAGIALAATHFMKGQEFYRSILIYELQGSADIEREGAGNIKAAEDLYLESGDRLTVADGSSMRLKLDDDKYVMVEENSVLAIEAAGNEADSKTRIQLEQGAVTSEIPRMRLIRQTRLWLCVEQFSVLRRRLMKTKKFTRKSLFFQVKLRWGRCVKTALSGKRF